MRQTHDVAARLLINFSWQEKEGREKEGKG